MPRAQLPLLPQVTSSQPQPLCRRRPQTACILHETHGPRAGPPRGRPSDGRCIGPRLRPARRSLVTSHGQELSSRTANLSVEFVWIAAWDAAPETRAACGLRPAADGGVPGNLSLDARRCLAPALRLPKSESYVGSRIGIDFLRAEVCKGKVPGRGVEAGGVGKIVFGNNFSPQQFQHYQCFFPQEERCPVPGPLRRPSLFSHKRCWRVGYYSMRRAKGRGCSETRTRTRLGVAVTGIIEGRRREAQGAQSALCWPAAPGWAGWWLGLRHILGRGLLRV